MEISQHVKNLSASIARDPRYTDLRLALYDRCAKGGGDVAVSHGMFIGLASAFQEIENWAAEGEATPLKQPESTTIEPQTSFDPDMER